jgi:hypothetical protein
MKYIHLYALLTITDFKSKEGDSLTKNQPGVSSTVLQVPETHEKFFSGCTSNDFTILNLYPGINTV